MRKGERIAGCAMAPGRAGKREWTAEPDQISAVGKLMGVETTVAKQLTPAQVIKAGVPEGMVAALSKRHPGKQSIVTDAIERTQKLFS